MKRNIHIKHFVSALMIISIIISSQDIFASRKFTLGIGVTNYDGTKLGIQPGDTVIIEAGHRDHLRINNIHGDSLNYIVFINDNGIVEISTNTSYVGFKINDCSFFKLTGTGSPKIPYGIQVRKTITGSSGISLVGSSSNYEIEHIEICNSGFAGFFANQPPDCDNKMTRGNFLIRNISFHDNYIHKTAGEGIYVGHSSYTGYTVTCDSVKTVRYPPEIHGVKIYNNLVDSAGWDGIQVGCATQGCEIYNNKIRYYGFSNVTWQQTGIEINPGTGGNCYNNLIMNGTGGGIYVFGIGGNKIYNNLIINPGYAMNDSMVTANSFGIFCDDRCTTPGSSFYFLNNSIISPKGDGIRIYSKETKGNVFSNNLILHPGSYGTYNSYFNPMISYVNAANGVDLTLSNNYFSTTLPSSLNLNDIDALYNYCAYLPIINKGNNFPENQGIATDFNGNKRIVNSNCDIGAFEYPDSIAQNKTKQMIKIVQNPGTNDISVTSVNQTLITNIFIYDLSGKMIYNNQPMNKETTLSLSNNLQKGVYIVYTSTETNTNVNKICLL